MKKNTILSILFIIALAALALTSCAPEAVVENETVKADSLDTLVVVKDTMPQDTLSLKVDSVK